MCQNYLFLDELSPDKTHQISVFISVPKYKRHSIVFNAMTQPFYNVTYHGLELNNNHRSSLLFHLVSHIQTNDFFLLNLHTHRANHSSTQTNNHATFLQTIAEKSLLFILLAALRLHTKRFSGEFFERTTFV